MASLPSFSRWNRLLLVVGVGVLGISQCLFTVKAGERALIFDKFSGVKPNVMAEGTHLLIPYIQTPIYFDVKITPRTIRAETGTKDLQKIQIQLRVLFRPDHSKLREIFVTPWSPV